MCVSDKQLAEFGVVGHARELARGLQICRYKGPQFQEPLTLLQPLVSNARVLYTAKGISWCYESVPDYRTTDSPLIFQRELPLESRYRLKRIKNRSEVEPNVSFVRIDSGSRTHNRAMETILSKAKS